ncbi:uncharacterized protein I303_108703 [Kwoniella dejecticola CBS 10117]|uniref:Zn(2)-C6 fungal-type domain-containing protein n=1 Tax=Kwoniella dejecticola CBS 10117 TaxID=1296121 RepID=A0AAJ8ML25_9TREE
MEGPTLNQPWAQYGLTATGKQKRKRVRSVMGCMTCRKRRVKCDEKRPKCSNCARHPLRICEYEYDHDNEHEKETENADAYNSLGNGYDPNRVFEKAQLDALGAMSLDTSFQDSSSFASSSTLTLDDLQPLPLTSSSYVYQPPIDYEKMSKERHVLESMRAEWLNINDKGSNNLMNPSELVQNKIPTPKQSRFTSFRSFHSGLVRRYFPSSEDPHNRLPPNITSAVPGPALYNGSGISLGTQPSSLSLSPDINHLHRSDIFRNPVNVGTVEDNKDVSTVGNLGSTAFNLLLCQIMEPSPTVWRDRLRSVVDKCIEKGGPGWMIGLTPPLSGYRGGPVENKQPLSMALYLEMAAMIDIYASLTSGSIPRLTSSDQSWISLSRTHQAKLSPPIPDTLETIFGIPRTLVPVFSRVTSLVARRTMQNLDDQMDVGMKEDLDFEIMSMRMELEHLWPARLAGRTDERRSQYGGRLWRLALLILLLQEAQMYSTTSSDLISSVNSFTASCQEALSEIGHLSGWLWPILISACATGNHTQREGFLRLLPYAKFPMGNSDNSEYAHKLLTMVWFYQDTGNPRFHLREARRIDNTSDNLIL